MKTLTIFVVPDDAKVQLQHDSGPLYQSRSGEADGRPAQLIDLDEALPDGWGAWQTITWTGGATLKQHGSLWLKERASIPLPRAEFIPDVFQRPQSF